MKNNLLPMGSVDAMKSQPIYDFRILRDVKVPMRDGVKLSVNIFLPDTEGRFPVIFERMPYGASGCGPGEFYAKRGYAFVIQDCRGRHDSEGEFWQDFLKHSQYDEYWKRMSVIHGRFDQVDVPAYIMCGWYDYYPGESFDAFNGMRAEARDKARKQSRIIMGPWSHLISISPKLGEVDFGAHSQLNIDELALRWFDCLLKDMDTGILDEPPVSIFVMGINEWRHENEWPLARTRFTEYYLHSQGVANSNPDDGYLSVEPPRNEPPDQYVYDPDDPVPTLGGNHSICWADAFHMIQPGPFDQRSIEQRRDVLTYTTSSMEADTEVTGPIVLHLYAATDAPDTDWTAKVLDVYPDGRAINLTEGNLRARFRKSIYEAPELLEPDKVYAYRIEIQPTSNVFLNGHRIRLEISSSNFPLWDRNPNTGHKQGQDAELRTARQTIFHSSEYPSRIVLPLIPREPERDR